MLVLFALLLLITACLDTTVTPPPPDVTAPMLHVTSPVDSTYDDDGDQRVDVRVTWADSGGAVDPATATLRALEGVNGPATADTNLLDVWQVEERDSAGLVVHETLANLLHPGANRVELRVADTAGNVATDTLRFTLPYGAFWKTVPSGLTFGVEPAEDLTICSDDGLLYMTDVFHLVVVDPDSLKVLAVVKDPYAADGMSELLCIPGDPILYATQRVERFDRTTRTFLPPVTGSFGSIGIVQSKLNPDTLYVGEHDAIVGLIDRRLDKHVGGILPLQTYDEFISAVAVLPGDTKLYAAVNESHGVLVADPRTNTILKTIAVGGPEFAAQGDSGDSQSLALSKDARWLYAAVDDGLPLGVVKIDTQTDSVVKAVPLLGSPGNTRPYVGIKLGLSPDETRLFVTSQDNGTPSENALIDVVHWKALAWFPRPRTTVHTRFDRGVLFRPDGKLIFVARDVDLDVYLNRE